MCYPGLSVNSSLFTPFCLGGFFYYGRSEGDCNDSLQSDAIFWRVQSEHASNAPTLQVHKSRRQIFMSPFNNVSTVSWVVVVIVVDIIVLAVVVDVFVLVVVVVCIVVNVDPIP